MADPQVVRDVLTAAVGILRERGCVRGMLHRPGVGFCAVGAIGMAAMEAGYPAEVAHVAVRHVERVALDGTRLQTWHDVRGSVERTTSVLAFAASVLPPPTQGDVVMRVAPDVVLPAVAAEIGAYSGRLRRRRTVRAAAAEVGARHQWPVADVAAALRVWEQAGGHDGPDVCRTLRAVAEAWAARHAVVVAARQSPPPPPPVPFVPPTPPAPVPARPAEDGMSVDAKIVALVDIVTGMVEAGEAVRAEVVSHGARLDAIERMMGEQVAEGVERWLAES